MLISFSLITFLMCIETNFNRTRLKICILTVSYVHCLKMFYYKGQPCIPSFSIWLVKTESDFIVKSFKTGLGRWTLVVAVISVWCLSFFSFLRPDLSPWGYGNRCFLVALYCLIVRRRNLEVATKRCKPDNFESHDSLILALQIFEAFVRILLNVNLSLNQTLVTFLLYVRQTWMTQLILAISLWGVLFL